jgi:hypothetical protein
MYCLFSALLCDKLDYLEAQKTLKPSICHEPGAGARLYPLLDLQLSDY